MKLQSETFELMSHVEECLRKLQRYMDVFAVKPGQLSLGCVPRCCLCCAGWVVRRWGVAV